MKRLFTIAAAALIGTALPTLDAKSGGDGMTDRDRASAAAASLGAELKRALIGAMSSSGPVAAIDVCKTQAPAIAARVSAHTGLRVGRTSARTRNPGNFASDWQAAVLSHWQQQRAQGEDLAAVDYFEQLPDGGFRYMKPILAQPLCLTCHGAKLSPSVEAALGAAYPDDHARGYAAGDLRGAFVVER